MNSWRCVLGTYFTKVINDTLCFAANPQLLKGCGARPHLTQNVSGRSGVILLRIEDAGRTGGTDPLPPPLPPRPARLLGDAARTFVHISVSGLHCRMSLTMVAFPFSTAQYRAVLLSYAIERIDSHCVEDTMLEIAVCKH